MVMSLWPRFLAHPVHKAALARSDAAKIRCNFSTEKLCGLLDIFVSFRLISTNTTYATSRRIIAANAIR